MSVRKSGNPLLPDTAHQPHKGSLLRASVCLAALALGGQGAAHAQAAADANTGAGSKNTAAAPAKPGAAAPRSDKIEDIVVTARKKKETLLDTPLVVTALSKKALESYAVTDYQAVANQVPGLLVNTSGGATGGSIALRGVQTGTDDASLSQPVSLDIDGVQISRAQNLNLAFFDLSQIEVLKGPQSLFFGKNSPGGVINISTADPGDHFGATLRYQYEFGAAENLGLMTVDTGPLVDGLTARISYQGRGYDGYFKNTATASGAPFSPITGPSGSSVPNGLDNQFRIVSKYTNNDDFDVRTNYTFFTTDNSGPNVLARSFACPASGFQRFFDPKPAGDCSLNGQVIYPNINGQDTPTPGAFPSNGQAFAHETTMLGSVQANYHFLDRRLTLSSVTGYYGDRLSDTGDSSELTLFSAVPQFSEQDYDSFSQEVRLASNLGGRFDFLLGGLYEHEHNYIFSSDAFDTRPLGGPLVQLGPLIHTTNTTTYSGFGQGTYKLPFNVTLSAGARWTVESHDFLHDYTEPPVTHYHLQSTDHNVSPEVTLSWKPQREVNFYGSYKQGFKSGGFSTSVFFPPDAASLRYKPETVDGGEIGVKMHLLQDTVSLNIDAFDYTYHNLQTSLNVPGTPVQITANALKTKTEGVEADGVWRVPAVTGLGLHGAVNYDEADAVNFTTICYGSQTPAAGCLLNPVGGAFTEQSLNGTQLAQAPKWSSDIGVSYDGELSDRLLYSAATDVEYTGSYQSVTTNDPRGRQDATAKLNASLQVYTDDNKWRLALIGRNLTNVLRVLNGTDTLFSVGGTGTKFANPTDLYGFYTQPRQIFLQLTRRF